jgi:thiamine biosynthesis lipoprotein
MARRAVTFRGLGGPCSFHLFAADAGQLDRAASAGRAEVQRIEEKYSRYRADSTLSQINAKAGDPDGVIVDAETAALIDYAAAAHEQSKGVFDITSGVLRRAWDFRAARIPTAQEIDALLPLVGWHQVVWKRPRLVLPRSGMEIDFGGFGKEYAVDRVGGILKVLGIEHGMIELGGDLAILGPHPDGSPWRVGIRHPRLPGAVAGTIDVDRGAVATSGDYERYFERDGRRYSHILDPRTGWPVEGPPSVTVMAPQCLVAGTATTIAMLKGADAPAWLDSVGLPWMTLEAGGGATGTIMSDNGRMGLGTIKSSSAEIRVRI